MRGSLFVCSLGYQLEVASRRKPLEGRRKPPDIVECPERVLEDLNWVERIEVRRERASLGLGI